MTEKANAVSQAYTYRKAKKMKKIKLNTTNKRVVTPRVLMQEIASDRSSWCSVLHYPDTATCRRMIALGDKISDPKPTAPWWTWRLKFAHPNWSNRQIADHLGISHDTVARNLEDIEINMDCYLPKSMDEEHQEMIDEIKGLFG